MPSGRTPMRFHSAREAEGQRAAWAQVIVGKSGALSLSLSFPLV